MNPPQRDHALKQRIMRRVYALWVLRKIVHPVTAKLALVFALAWKSTDFISYTNVLANLPSDITDITHHIAFAESALSQTEVATLVILPLILAFFAWLVSDIVRHKRAYI